MVNVMQRLLNHPFFLTNNTFVHSSKAGAIIPFSNLQEILKGLDFEYVSDKNQEKKLKTNANFSRK